LKVKVAITAMFLAMPGLMFERNFYSENCSVSFGENIAHVTCKDWEDDQQYHVDYPVVTVGKDTRFVVVDHTLYYLDPSFIKLEESASEK
jgi:hypothetical protein